VLDEDGDLTGLLELLTASEPVLARVADDVEREPVDADLLAALRRTAQGPAQRAAVTLLAARSAEREGRADEAADLVEEALKLAPDLVPALCDAAEYAATRGDVIRADGLLQRAGFVSDEGLRRSLRPLTSLPPGTTARNRPCPCGSRLKYKMCCLRNAVHPLPARAVLLYGLLLAYTWRAAQREHIELLIELSDPAAGSACTDLALFEGGIAGEFFDRRGAWLRDDERELLTRWLQTPLRLYEVVSVSPGREAVVRPLPDDDPIVLRDRMLSLHAEPLDLMLARLLDNGAGPALFADPFRVNRLRRSQLLALLSDEIDPYSIARFFGPQPIPELRNQDGHELVQCSATYEIGHDDGAWDKLAASLSDDGPDRLVAVNDHLIRGFVRRDGARLTLETNSLERLRELQQLLLAAAPHARLISESSVPMEKLAGSEPPTGLPAPETASPEELKQVVEQFMRQQEERWIDESIPALGGLTPRQAAARGSHALAELNALLDDLDWACRQQGGGMSGQRIRRLLA